MPEEGLGFERGPSSQATGPSSTTEPPLPPMRLHHRLWLLVPGLNRGSAAVLGMMVYLGALVRFQLDIEGSVDVDTAVGIALVGLVASGLRSIPSASRGLQYFWVLLDLCLVTALYYLRQKLESDFFLFFCLPLVSAAVHLDLSGIKLIALLNGLTLFFVLSALGPSAQVPSSGWTLLLTAILPREMFISLVAVIAIALKRSLLLHGELRWSLAQVVPQIRSPARLQAEVDRLLDRVVKYGFHCGAIGLVDEHSRKLDIVGVRNIASTAKTTYPLVEAAIEGESLLSKMVREPERGYHLLSPGSEPAASVPVGYARLLVPLVSRKAGAVVGILECGRDGEGAEDFVRGAAERLARDSRPHADRIAPLLPSSVMTKSAQLAYPMISADAASIYVRKDNEILYYAYAGKGRIRQLERLPADSEELLLDAMRVDRVMLPDEAELRARGQNLHRSGVRALAGFPMRFEAQTGLRGVLGVYFSTPHRVTPEEVDIMEGFAEQLGVAIQGFRSMQETVRLAERSFDVLDLQTVVQSMAVAGDVKSMLGVVAQATLDYLRQAISVSVYEFDKETGYFVRPPVTRSHGPVELHRDSEGELETTLVCSDHFPKRSQAPVAKILLRAPGSAPEGLLVIQHRPPFRWDETERRAILSLTSAAAIALANARLLESERKQKHQIEELQETVRELNTPLQLKDVTRATLQQFAEYTSCTTASLQRIQGNERRLIDAFGFDPHEALDLIGPIDQDQLLRKVLASPIPSIENDTSLIDGWRSPDVKSWIGVPLRYGGVVIGLVTLDHPNKNAFREADPLTLAQIARDAGANFFKALRYDEAIKSLELLTSVYRVIDQHPQQDQLADIAAAVVTGMECSECTVFLKRGGEEHLERSTTKGQYEHVIRERKEGATLSLVTDAASPLVSTFWEGRRVWTHPLRATSPRGGSEARRSQRSSLAAPIAVGAHKFGVIVAERNASFFSDSDMLLMDAVAKATGAAIERNLGLELVRDVGHKIIGAAQLDAVMEEITKGVVTKMDVDASVIFLGDRSGADFNFSQPFGWPPGEPIPTPRPGGLTVKIMSEGETVEVEDVPSSLLVAQSTKRRYGSLIGLPLTTADRVEGVLFLFTRRRRQFTPAERSVLEALANQAGLVIQKTRRMEALDRLAAFAELTHGFFHAILSPSAHIVVEGRMVAEALAEVSKVGPRGTGASHDVLTIPRRAHDAASAGMQKIRAYADRINAGIMHVKDTVDRLSPPAAANAAPGTLAPIPPRHTIEVGTLLGKAIERVVGRNEARQTDRLGLEPAMLDGDFSSCRDEVMVHEELVTEALACIIENGFEAVERKRGRVEISVLAKGRVVEVVINDNGGGIPPTVLQKLHSIDASSKAHGVACGLWFVKWALQAAGAPFHFSGVEGVSTTVSILLERAHSSTSSRKGSDRGLN